VCNLTNEQKQFIIDCINATFQAGAARGNLQAVTHTVMMANQIIQELSNPLEQTNGKAPDLARDSIPAPAIPGPDRPG
jgi:hypothetical protein